MKSKKDRRKVVADECCGRGAPKLHFSLALAGGRQVICQFLFAMCIDAVAGVPIAVVIKTAGLFEDAGELHAARAHVVNVSLGVLVAVFKGALLLVSPQKTS